MAPPPRLVQRWFGILFGALLTGCASTTVTLAPSPQAPVCEPSTAALVLWAPQWRADQKDAAEREVAAATGLTNFFAGSGCFARAEVRRIPDPGAASVTTHVAATAGEFNRVVVVGVRELGPVVKLLSSAALVEGGTEVALEVAVYAVPPVAPSRQFTVHWHNGGPGVIRGVASLPADMQAALIAGLQPGAAAR